MAASQKIFEKMARNPRADFTMDNVKSVCRANDVECKQPTGSSHYVVSHHSQTNHLTIPFKRPIKPVYIRLLVAYILAVKAHVADGKSPISDSD
jgi:hypothetical protein